MAQVSEANVNVAVPSSQVSTVQKIAPRGISWKCVLKGHGKGSEFNPKFSGFVVSKVDSGIITLPAKLEMGDDAMQLDNSGPLPQDVTAVNSVRFRSDVDERGHRTITKVSLKRTDEETSTAKQLSAFISSNACLTSSRGSRAMSTEMSDPCEDTSVSGQSELIDNKNFKTDVIAEADVEELDTNGNVFPGVRERTHVKTELTAYPVVVMNQAAQQGQRQSDGRMAGEKRYYCEKCGLGFDKMSYFTRHLKGKFHSLDSLECSCEICLQQSTPSSSSTKESSSRKVYTCEVCGKALNCPLLLRKHMCVHTSKNMCKVCGKKFMLVHKLHEHMLFHTGENKCEICGKTFMRSVSLEQHMYVHKDQKPFSCTICGKQFICEGGFKRHQYVHKQNNISTK